MIQSMEHWGAPVLTGYSCKDLPPITTQSNLLLTNDKIRPNTQPELTVCFIKSHMRLQ